MRKNKHSALLFDFSGDWYVPNLGQKLEGHLKTKKQLLYLELFTENTFENQVLSDNLNVNYYSYPIIIGNSVRNGQCTLYKCTWAGIKQISGKRYRLKYQVEFAFLNAVIENENELLVKSANFTFSHLSSWYDGAESLHRLNAYTGIFVNGIERPLDTLNKHKTVKITENIDFVFIDSFERSDTQSGNSYEKRFQKYLRIQFKVPVLFDELISTAAYFSNLLEVSLFKKIPFIVHDITFIEDAYSHLESHQFNSVKSSIVVNFSLSGWMHITDGIISQHRMLISRWKFDEDSLNNIIRIWFSNRIYSHIYDYFIDSHVWEIGSQRFVSNVIFNNKFLNMLQGVEGFHKIFYGNEKPENSRFLTNKADVLKLIKEPKLKNWLNDNLNPPKTKYTNLKDKIEHLIIDFTPFLIVRFGEMDLTNNFFQRAVAYRNILSHGSQKSTNQGEEFSKLFLAIQYLLALCILKTLKINNPDNTVKHNIYLNDSANAIIEYVNKNIEKYS